MNIIEATKLLQQGKKIRRKIWVDKAYLYIEPNNHLIVNDWREYFRPAVDTLLADDWEEKITKGELNKKEFSSKSKFCWHCGSKENLTSHHLQMKKYRKSKSTDENIEKGTIPLCKDCHVGIEKLRNNAEKVYRAKHKEILMKAVEHSHIITEKQKMKLMPQLNEIWNTK